jgi:hypothetical protein
MKSPDDNGIPPEFAAIASTLNVNGSVDVSLKTNSSTNLGEAVHSALLLARLLNAPVAMVIGAERFTVPTTQRENEDAAAAAILDQVHAALVRAREQRDG